MQPNFTAVNKIRPELTWSEVQLHIHTLKAPPTFGH